jgi:hypothetical protein
MSSNQIISELVDTVICGNRVRGNSTYEKMAKKVSFRDLQQFFNEREYELSDLYWYPTGRFAVRPKNSTGEYISKLDFFDINVKASF